MKQILAATILTTVVYGCQSSRQLPVETGAREKTAFQTGNEWRPTIDVQADVAIIYGARGSAVSFDDRVKSWRDRGYSTHFMTGIAWGGRYAPYFSGEWDGKKHWEDAQLTKDGDTLWHGSGKVTPYIVPSSNFLNYLKEEHIKRAIDAGIDAIYLEEPEFWARAGYSQTFKDEWRKYYGFDWRPQHLSPENTYLSNKLKYHLYYQALDECFRFAKEYGKTKGINVRCYVPTHSLINYAQWGIVSPEASLASLPSVDGYIAQVWTGTSAEPNYYNGQAKERVFEAAYLEYGCMEAMTEPTGRKMFFLTDPIEDREFDWPYYKQNYQATFVAKLLYSRINNYEVMPWPARIYEKLYYTSAHFKKGGGINSKEELIDSANAHKNTKALIPRFYSTQMQVMINSLNQMPVSDNKVSGSWGISVLMANSIMFQRTPAPVYGYEDPQLSNFYGFCMPFLKRGVPVKTLHLENVGYAETWKDTKILLMSYSIQKPSDEQSHQHIASWVKNGGVLVYSARDNDPFQSVEEWWNRGGHSFKRPSDHLFSLMGMGENPGAGTYQYGKGTVHIIRQDPKEFILVRNADAGLVNTVQYLYSQQAKSGSLQFKNNFYLERGFFNLISVMEESVSDEPFISKGLFIDLFDPELPVLTEKQVKPGEQAYLVDLSRVKNKNQPQILAAASRAHQEVRTKNRYSFVAKSPLNASNVMRVLLPRAPITVIMKDHHGNELDATVVQWDEQSYTCLLKFENNPEGVQVIINW